MRGCVSGVCVCGEGGGSKGAMGRTTTHLTTIHRSDHRQADGSLKFVASRSTVTSTVTNARPSVVRVISLIEEIHTIHVERGAFRRGGGGGADSGGEGGGEGGGDGGGEGGSAGAVGGVAARRTLDGGGGHDLVVLTPYKHQRPRRPFDLGGGAGEGEGEGEAEDEGRGGGDAGGQSTLKGERARERDERQRMLPIALRCEHISEVRAWEAKLRAAMEVGGGGCGAGGSGSG